jgi:hypothetical protein
MERQLLALGNEKLLSTGSENIGGEDTFSSPRSVTLDKDRS